MEQSGKRISIQNIVEQSIEETSKQDNMAGKDKTKQIEAGKQWEALLTPPDSNALRDIDSPSEDTDTDGISSTHALVQSGLLSAPQSRIEPYTQQELDAANGLLKLSRAVPVQLPPPRYTRQELDAADRLLKLSRPAPVQTSQPVNNKKLDPELRERAKLHEMRYQVAKAMAERASHIGPQTEEDILLAGRLLNMSVETWEKTLTEHAAGRVPVAKAPVRKRLPKPKSTSTESTLTSHDASTDAKLTPPTESSTAREAPSEVESEAESGAEYTPSVASKAAVTGKKRKRTNDEEEEEDAPAKKSNRKSQALWELRPPSKPIGDIFCRFAREMFNERGDNAISDKDNRAKDATIFQDGKMLCPEDGPESQFYQQEHDLAAKVNLTFEKYQVCKYRFFLATALLIEYNLRLEQRKKTSATPVKTALLELNRTRAQLFSNVDVNHASTMFNRWQEFGWTVRLTDEKKQHVNRQCTEGYPVEVRKALMKELIKTEDSIHAKGGILVAEREELTY